MTKPFFPPNF